MAETRTLEQELELAKSVNRRLRKDLKKALRVARNEQYKRTLVCWCTDPSHQSGRA